MGSRGTVSSQLHDTDSSVPRHQGSIPFITADSSPRHRHIPCAATNRVINASRDAPAFTKYCRQNSGLNVFKYFKFFRSSTLPTGVDQTYRFKNKIGFSVAMRRLARFSAIRSFV
jgi:hypothetical protein